MADGVDAAEDLLRHGVGQRAGVPQRVQDVERQPANAEDGADPEREGGRLVFAGRAFEILNSYSSLPRARFCIPLASP